MDVVSALLKALQGLLHLLGAGAASLGFFIADCARITAEVQRRLQPLL